ncbi:16S rRNA (guanine(527)-N(7))-methyltransferase RsmG [Flavimaricola marinus]|uniref:Ribosomal RNA small subunit methyltransferase G n=1 Tax=Flavimaricola marinus TaxID=1819565 RepID=A0A238LE31_9RHOB|nr:16S rRNA (guanine(527)-N(7))-methyltransferase RsmG [Flavimaricola marinus]SMY07190.1 Ribosomal RNA small subunit methyltransferase G [Flavimaricola marinus]
MSEPKRMLLPGWDVSRETMAKLEQYGDLIRKWTPKINLVAPASLPDLWERHILDSAQLLPLAPTAPKTWTDLGSGGGLPGIVIAILSPDTEVTLIESDQRKAAFLRTCTRELGLSATIRPNRIDEVAPLGADVVTARALAPLPNLLPLVARHLAPDGIALLPKGKNAQTEIDDARADWGFDLQTHTSHTNPEATILRLERITRA